MGKSKDFPAADGVYVALVTPRAHDSVTVDAAALFDYLDIIMRANVDGVVLFGSTGEFVHFDIGERIRVLMLANKRCRIPLLVNVSHSTLAGAVELADDAIEAGAAGLLVMPPYYFHYTGGQIAEFYRQFAKAVDSRARMYLYNIPQFTDPIPAEVMADLLSSGAFAGVKDSSGDWELFEKLLGLREKVPFRLLVGNDVIYAKARTLGADGIVSGVAAAIPELLVALDRALTAHDQARADLLDGRLHEFLGWLDKFPAPCGIRLAAAIRGWKTAHFASPFDDQTTAARQEFEGWFRTWLPGVLAEAGAVRS